MNLIRLRQCLVQDFAKETYYNNFAYEERRPWASIEDLIKEDYYNFYVIQEKEEPIGIITIWSFYCFIYIEHFAIKESLQGKGYGSKTIQYLQNTIDKDIVLEIEQPITLLQKKRLSFYAKLNFVAFKEKYIQPPYHKDSLAVELILMKYSKQKSINNFSYLQHTLYKEVYGVK